MNLARAVAMTALAFLGITAIAGAIPMLLSPGGSPQYMPPSLLHNTPFHTFLIPGIVLFSANGLLSLWILWLVIRRRRGCGLWVAAQGCVLLGWLLVQCWMLQIVMWLHYTYGALALLLVASGWVLHRRTSAAAAAQG
jgi:hypothetical protein